MSGSDWALVTAMPHTYEYPHPALTVDCVVFGYDESELKVLLIKRALDPFKGRWALPGGFVRVEESLDDAAHRELFEETGLKDISLEQLYTFGSLNRDPRERVVSVGYYALLKIADHQTKAGSDAVSAEWFPISKISKLAFDHAEILATALDRLKAKVRYQPIGFDVLPPKFTFSQLQRLYEAVFGVDLDRRNFRKKVLSVGLLLPVSETPMVGRRRPAKLFCFDAPKYEKLKKRGFNFEL
jgi:8-oxo-dGTP diphosphatase